MDQIARMFTVWLKSTCTVHSEPIQSLLVRTYISIITGIALLLEDWQPKCGQLMPSNLMTCMITMESNQLDRSLVMASTYPILACMEAESYHPHVY